MPVRDKVDFWFTADYDFETDDNGDLKDTSFFSGRSLLQEVRSRLRGRRGDWVLNKTLGANLEDFIGEPGTTPVIQAVVGAIRTALVSDGLIPAADLEVLTLPLTDSILLIRLVIQTDQGELTENLAYDSDTARFVGV
jgi:hypothetical protein